MGPCKVCVEKSDQIRGILRSFQLEHVDPVGGVRILGKSLAEARAQVAALTAERDAAKAELAAAKQLAAHLERLSDPDSVRKHNAALDQLRAMLAARAPEGTEGKDDDGEA